MKTIHIALIGGSGDWCNRNYCQALLTLKKEERPVKVTLICDPISPYTQAENENLVALLKLDQPTWLFESNQNVLLDELNSFQKNNPLDLVIISCNPVFHNFYCAWAASHHIPILCDKPLVVIPNSAFDLVKAQQIQVDYEKLKITCLKEDVSCVLALWRRDDSLFLNLAKQLKTVYEMTGQGISYLHLLTNTGIKRFSQEFLQGGSHGYLDGIGSASHSFYHYLDTVAWLLQNAPGRTVRIQLTIPYLTRVKDYLYQRKNLFLAKQLGFKETEHNLPEEVLLAEYDFNLQLNLLDENNQSCGLIQFFNCHSGFSPRTLAFDPNRVCPGDFPAGGRMKQFFLDLHQGSVQHIQLQRNHQAFEKSNATLFFNLHPFLKEKANAFVEFLESPGEIKMDDFIMTVIKQLVGLPVQKVLQLSGFENQALTQRLFSLTYEAIAATYMSRESHNLFVGDIELYDYFQISNTKI